MIMITYLDLVIISMVVVAIGGFIWMLKDLNETGYMAGIGALFKLPVIIISELILVILYLYLK